MNISGLYTFCSDKRQRQLDDGNGLSPEPNDSLVNNESDHPSLVWLSTLRKQQQLSRATSGPTSSHKPLLRVAGFIREEPRQPGSGRRRRFRHSIRGLRLVASGRQRRQERHRLPGQRRCRFTAAVSKSLELSINTSRLSLALRCVCALRSARCTERACWCAKATAADSFTWTVSA